MSKNINKITTLALLFTLVGCGGNGNSSTNSNTSTNNPTPNSSSSVIKEESVIKSLTAKQELVELKEGESVLLTQLYTIEGNTKLSAKQKNCSYVSSNPEVISIEGKTGTAVGVGETTITVTSDVDTSKTCSFDIKVSGTFFDKDLTFVVEGDDLSNEMNDETGTGSIQTKSMQTNYYYIREVKSKKWFVETEITLNQVNNDRYPKVGIFASARNSTGAETMVSFFLNADIGLNDVWNEETQSMDKGEDNLNWTSFGVAEMAQGGQWAWNPGVGNSIARHNDAAYTVSDAITFGTKFTLGLARDDMNFHVYVNKTYAFTYALSTDLTILFENGNTLESNVGFFHYNSDVTFSNYMKTTDDTEVNKYIPKSFTPCTFFED